MFSSPEPLVGLGDVAVHRGEVVALVLKQLVSSSML